MNLQNHYTDMLKVWGLNSNPEGAKFVYETTNVENSLWCGQLFDTSIVELQGGALYAENAEGHQDFRDWHAEFLRMEAFCKCRNHGQGCSVLVQNFPLHKTEKWFPPTPPHQIFRNPCGYSGSMWLSEGEGWTMLGDCLEFMQGLVYQGMGKSIFMFLWKCWRFT